MARPVSIFIGLLVCATTLGNIQSYAEYQLGQFNARLYSNKYPARTFKGYFATNNQGQCRIAFYWLNPAIPMNLADNLAYSDFLFDRQSIFCWIHKPNGGLIRSEFDVNEIDTHFTFPEDHELKSVLKAILSAVQASRYGGQQDVQWQARQFFKACEGLDKYEHTVKSPSDLLSLETASESSLTDAQLFNQLPFGRTYSKTVMPDGTCIWDVSKASGTKRIVRLIISPLETSEKTYLSEVFDPNSLGCWSIVPASYRKYWQFKQRYISLRRSKLKTEAQGLYTDIHTHLDHPLSDELALALKKLRFKVSVEQGNEQNMSNAAHEYFSSFLTITQEPVDRSIIELGRIAKDLRKRWSDEKTRQWVYPQLQSLIEPDVFINKSFLQKLISSISVQNWPWYSQLLLEAVEEKTSPKHS